MSANIYVINELDFFSSYFLLFRRDRAVINKQVMAVFNLRHLGSLQARLAGSHNFVQGGRVREWKGKMFYVRILGLSPGSAIS